MITLIGLGISADDLTMGALNAMRSADRVLVRNESPVCEGLRRAGISYETLDFVYERSRNYDTLAKNLASEVRAAAKTEKVCYCVEGGVCEDRAARLLLGKGTVTVEGVSKAGYAAARAGLSCAYQAVSAYEMERKLTLPLVIYDLNDRLLAGDVKLLLEERFGDEADCYFLSGEKGKRISLFEADRQEEYSSLTSLVVYDRPLAQKKRFDYEDLIAILRRLRAPDGCPWDRVQTHESIRIDALEEAYELVDAIDLGDPDKIREESGDVLLQSAFHALIEEEKGNFSVGDMLSELCNKLITRHSHIFGQDKADSAEGALSVWEKNKMTEKHQHTYSDAVNDVPQCFPALLRAQKIAKRVEKGGWDGALSGAEEKLREEYGELLRAYEKGDKEGIREEMGDLLFSMAWLAHAVGTDAEMALLDTVKKVQRRYTAYERLIRADGKDPLNLTQEEKDLYYERAKHS